LSSTSLCKLSSKRPSSFAVKSVVFNSSLNSPAESGQFCLASPPLPSDNFTLASASSNLPDSVAVNRICFASCLRPSSPGASPFLCCSLSKALSNLPDDVASRRVCFACTRRSSVLGGALSAFTFASASPDVSDGDASRSVFFASASDSPGTLVDCFTFASASSNLPDDVASRSVFFASCLSCSESPGALLGCFTLVRTSSNFPEDVAVRRMSFAC